MSRILIRDIFIFRDPKKTVHLFEGLQSTITNYLPSEQVALVREAFVIAQTAHEGQMRSSGDPYITHPVAVARILAEMQFDHETIMAALLHDVIEDTHFTYDDLAGKFGEVVADLVNGVSKLDKIKFSNREEAQVENFRKMMMAMVEDIRVILIKLADRTHNMRTLGSLKPEKRRRIATETLEIYAPLAHRLGIYDMKNELEDLGFQAMYPMRHRALYSELTRARGNRKEVVDNIIAEIEARLAQNNLPANVIGREKHLYSIYRKMQNKELSFREIMDIYAFRLMFDTVDQCYRALGVMHGLFTPIENRFKDYIAIPRTNGYQSLHTSLKGPHGLPIEIQIRTHDMDIMADKGVAAHWLYKAEDDPNDLSTHIKTRKWMQSILELQQSASSSYEFVENVKSDLFPDEIYVFTPKGTIIELPTGACAVDFAYAVHSDVGNRCVGARVDKRNFSLSQPLENGQSIEIITSPRAKPNANWLNYVVTAKARSFIRQYLKRQQSEDANLMGLRLLRHALGSVRYESIPAMDLQHAAQECGYEHFDDLLKAIGLGNELAGVVARRLIGDSESLITEEDGDKKGNVAIKGTEGLLLHYSKCCYPIPNDEIVAVLNPGKGMMIHQVGCSNIRKLAKEEPQRVLPMEWDEEVEGEFKASLRIELINRQGVLAKLTNTIASSNSNIFTMFSDEKDANLYFVDIVLTTLNRKHFADIMRRIRAISEVQRVSRHSQSKMTKVI